MQQAKLATEIHILDKGKLKVTKNQGKESEKIAEIYKIGSFFGELSLVSSLCSVFTILEKTLP